MISSGHRYNILVVRVYISLEIYIKFNVNIKTSYDKIDCYLFLPNAVSLSIFSGGGGGFVIPKSSKHHNRAGETIGYL